MFFSVLSYGITLEAHTKGTRMMQVVLLAIAFVFPLKLFLLTKSCYMYVIDLNHFQTTYEHRNLNKIVSIYGMLQEYFIRFIFSLKQNNICPFLAQQQGAPLKVQHLGRNTLKRGDTLSG